MGAYRLGTSSVSTERGAAMTPDKLPTVPRQRRGALIAVLVAVAALMAALSAQLLVQPRAIGALPERVQLNVGAKADYGGWGTYMMEIGGNRAFCVQPHKTTPPSGQYATAPLDAPSGKDDLVRAMLYFGYGGPGYDASIWPKSWPLEGDPEMTQARLYALTHLTASYAWLGDMGTTLYRVWPDRAQWFYKNLFGVNDKGATVNANAPYLRIAAHVDEVPDSFQAFEVHTGNNDQIIVGWRIGCDVTFTKTSANASVTSGGSPYSLEGAEYDIYEQATQRKVASITTDRNGRAELTLEPDTSYYAIETKAPAGFVLNNDPVRFKTDGGSVSVTLPDEPQTVSILVRKKDAAAGDVPQSGTSLAGATFEIAYPSDEGTKTMSVTTDEKGLATAEGIPLGQIAVKETTAPEGYKLDPRPRVYTVRPAEQTVAVVELDTENDFLEKVIAFDIEISKFTETMDGEGTGIKKPAAGVRFEIVSNTTGKATAVIETDEDGVASTADPDCIPSIPARIGGREASPGPWFGEGERVEGISGALPYDAAGYTVREVAETVPEGFEKVDDWTISAEEIADGACLRYIVNNHSLNTRLTIVKTDAASGQTVPLQGFSFQILDEAGDPVTLTSWYPNRVDLDTFTTDGTGSVTLPEKLEAGTYFIHETAVRAPYLLGEDVEFSVSADGTADKVTSIRYYNKQATGAVSVVKSDSETGEALVGAEFDIRAAENIVSPDGAVQATEGETVAHAITGGDGIAVAEGLPLGSGTARYTLVETKAPDGYTLDETPHEVELSWKDGSTPVVKTRVEVQDSPSNLTVDKDLTGTDQAVPGAVFALWNSADERTASLDDGMGIIGFAGLEADEVRLVARSNDEQDAYSPSAEGDLVTCPLPFGEYSVEMRDADGAWQECGTATLEEAVARTTVAAHEGSAYALPVLLAHNADVRIAVTDENGTAAFRKLVQGSYRLSEVQEPAGYLPSHEIACIKVDGKGTVSPDRVDIDNDTTRVEISKRSVTGQDELPGASLSILDEQGDEIDSWVSGTEPHLVTGLEPGTYVLVETFAPKTHETSDSVTFTVEETGSVQRVEMRDEPIKVTGQVDKRQEVATPVAEDLFPSPSDAQPQREPGQYSYSVDFRNASSTWVDEFTVTDRIDAAEKGIAHLTSIVTPQAFEDFDGKLNVWYKTDRMTENDGTAANATLSDNHENPWLDDADAMAQDKDGDGRILEYDGWRLWAEGISATDRTELAVADLGLAEDECVIAVRLEYGRVEKGFSSRTELWDRDGLKNEHDDVDNVPVSYDETFATGDGKSCEHAPLILNMTAGQGYADGVELENSARVDLYRNGGGDDLESHDEDEVRQEPRVPMGDIPQTGVMGIGVGSALVATALVGLYILKRRM